MNIASTISRTLAVLVAAWPLVFPLHSGTPTPNPPTAKRKLQVTNPALRPALGALGATLIADYGSYQLWEADHDAMSKLAASPGVTERTGDDVIELHSGPIQTLPGAARVTAKSADDADFAGRRLHLVQFAGPVRPEWHQALQQCGFQIVSHVPRNAYLVYGEAAALKRLRAEVKSVTHLQWEGAYQTQHKFHPRVQAEIGKTLRGEKADDLFSVQLLRDEPANAETLHYVDLWKTKLLRQHKALGYVNLVVRLPPERLNDLAARPDVVFIRRYIEPRKNDERQGIILSGQVTLGQPNGPGYLAWLEGLGFNQAQFTASGFGVDITDSGIDNGTTQPGHFGLYPLGDTNQPGRVLYNRLIGTPGGGDDSLSGAGLLSTIQGCDGHGTINAHIVAGYDDLTGFPHADAAGYHFGLGIAPFVKVGSSVIFDPDYFTYPDYTELQSKAYADGARISCNSWGASVEGEYTEDSQFYDTLVRDAQPADSEIPTAGNQEMVIVFSAGNSGPGSRSIGSPGTGKNIFCVGAAENVHSHSTAHGGSTSAGSDGCDLDDLDADSAEDIASFSSRGPCADGRVKPDLVGPGTHVTGGVAQEFNPGPLGTALSCFMASGVCALSGSHHAGSAFNFFPLGQQFFTTSSGTSHSCPAVGGGAALFRQWFLNHGWRAPSPAMTKAWLMNSARYLAGSGSSDTLPSRNQGLGEMNLGAAFGSGPRVFRDQLAEDKFVASGQVRVFQGVVVQTNKPLRVTLAWTDAPGATFGNAYNNDLDLTVEVSGQTYYGNVFVSDQSVAGGVPDTVNNVESVFLPPGFRGPFTVTVSAANINSDGVPNDADPLDQDFALVMDNASDREVLLVAAAAVTSGSCAPANGAIDPAETVTVEFALQNLGLSNTVNLVATLLPVGGVTAPGGQRSYGVVQAGGAAVSRPFTFSVLGACGGTVTPTLQLQDGTNDYGAVQYSFALGRRATNAVSFSNAAPVAISATDGVATPYPSPLAVSGVSGRVTQATLTLHRLSHSWFGDLQALLVGPQGQKALVLANAGGSGDAVEVTLTFDDHAAASLPEDFPVLSGAWKPTIGDAVEHLPPPAPTGPYGQNLSVFNDLDPNGEWRLFVADDYPSDDGGVITGGWSLTLTSEGPECCLPANATDLAVAVRDSLDPVPLTNDFSYTIVVSNLGPVIATGVVVTNWLPPEVVLVSATSSQGSWSEAAGVVRWAVGALSPTASATITLAVNPRGGPSLTNFVAVAADPSDFNPFNNGAEERTAVILPTLSVFDASVAEGDSGTSAAEFIVALSRSTFLTVQVDCVTASATAEAGVDFVAQSNRLTFLPGELTKSLSVPVVGDTFNEARETFRVRLLNPANVTLLRAEAIGTIVDNDPPPTVSISDASVVEGQSDRTQCVFTLSVTPPSGRAVTVLYRTTNGTARAGTDFLGVNYGQLTIPPRAATATLSISVNGDREVEPDETFAVVLASATNAVIAQAAGVGTIQTDDFAPRPALFGYRVTAEDQLPKNGEVDPGEQVVLSVAVRNIGTAPTTNLVVALRATNGVVAPGSPQNYGALAPGGLPVSRLFSFTAGVANCGLLRAEFEFKDGAADLGAEVLTVPAGGGAELFVAGLSSNNAQVVDHRYLTGHSHAAIAVSSNAVLVSGDTATARFDLETLAGGSTLGVRYEGLVSDLRTETVYVLAHGAAPISGPGETVTCLLELDSVAFTLTGRRIDLSEPVQLLYGSGLFAGFGQIVIWDTTRAYSIDTTSGLVTDLGLVTLPRVHSAAGWGFWGVAENLAGDLSLVYVADSQTVARTRLPSGPTTTVATFSNLGNLSAFTVSPRLGRWYFHFRYSSQFGSSEENLGYADAVLAVQCGNSPPRILKEPRDVRTLPGGTATLSVSAAGRVPLRYQWYKSGVAVPGGSTATLTMAPAQLTDAGAYHAVITNLYGATTSAVALLSVVTPVRTVFDDFEPDLDPTQWLSLSDAVAANSFGGHVSGSNSLWFGSDEPRFATTFPVDTSGGGAVSFWLRLGNSGEPWENVDLPEEGVVFESSINGGLTWTTLRTFDQETHRNWTEARFPIPSGARSGSTLFRWRQLDFDGSCCDHWAIDDVWITAAGTNDPPQILVQPRSQTTVEGGTVAFSVSVSGTAPFGYQWRRSGTNLPGASASALTLTNVHFSDAGGYSVTVSNAFGAVTSAVATLTVRDRLFVGVFDDPRYVDSVGGSSSESDTVQASLVSLGYLVETFTDIEVALQSYTVLLFPEFENGDPTSSLSPATRAGLSNFVAGGGLIVVHGSGSAMNFLNAILGSALYTAGGGGPYYRTAEAGAMEFADDALSLPDHSAVLPLAAASLPLGTLRIYTNYTQTAVALMPKGSGQLIYLGWDWYDAAPLGSKDGGWLGVLDSAMREATGRGSNRPPVILAGPASRTALEGASVTLAVRVHGTAPLGYQWRKEGTNLAGATNDDLSFANVQFSDAGDYSVVVTNAFGAVTSGVARLTVRASVTVAVFDDPRFVDTTGGNSAESDTIQASLASMQFQVVPFGDLVTAAASFNILLFPELENGDLTSALMPPMIEGLSNFVQRGGVMIMSGRSARSSSLLNAVFGFSISDTGGSGSTYRTPQVAGTEFADGPSQVPDLSAMTAFNTASLPPGSLSLYTNFNRTTVAMIPRGSGQIIYLGWDWFDAAPLGSQDGGWLAVLQSAALTGKPLTNQPPIIVAQPASRTTVVGVPVSLSATAVGTPPLDWQWRKDGVNLAWATSSSVTVTNPQLADSGHYSVVVTNAFGAATSGVATLTVQEGLLVSVFDDPRYVDTRGNYDSESDTVQASITSLGYVAGTFTNILAGTQQPVLLFPALKYGDLGSSISNTDRAALSNFVSRGGSFILHGYFSTSVSLLNSVFGFQVSASSQYPAEFALSAQAAGTEFADDSPFIPNLYQVVPLLTSSLPPSAQRIYLGSQDSAVAMIPFGSGRIIYLGWSWYDAEPLGAQDGGWLNVLDSAIREAAVATNALPAIVRPPASQRLPVGANALFSVLARGRGPLAYEWLKDGLAFPGPNSPSLWISNAQPDDVGGYSVRVTNAHGSALSAEAVLRLFTPGADLFDDFEPATDAAQWAAFGGLAVANSIGGAVSGVNSLWVGGDGARFATTRRLDTSRGGVVSFHLRLADSAEPPWETPELPGEGIVVEFSIDGGVSWETLAGCARTNFWTWTPVSVPIPHAARTTATQFRWRQLEHSGASFDHWAIDDVWIDANSLLPRLTLRHSVGGLTLTWPTAWESYVVEEADSLQPPVTWRPVTPPPPLTVVHGQNVLPLPAPSANKFYRLGK
ncbi:MAG: immunoglobulin domain-containing protein [Verrucomicrobia bacterium]|nr:immunoglobulin domain-containing protein [Verrucomicrobiota bacterium]